jgi:hypothetical protein
MLKTMEMETTKNIIYFCHNIKIIATCPIHHFNSYRGYRLPQLTKPVPQARYHFRSLMRGE